MVDLSHLVICVDSDKKIFLLHSYRRRGSFVNVGEGFLQSFVASDICWLECVCRHPELAYMFNLSLINVFIN